MRTNATAGETSERLPISPQLNQVELKAWIQELEDLENPKSSCSSVSLSFADSPFKDHISMVDMLEKCTFLLMRLFDVYVQGVWIEPRRPNITMVHSLPNSFIGSFGDPHTAFVEQFATWRKIKKHPGDLYSIKQRESESLRAFMACFN